jgi:ribose transport system substrate-binding protein
MHFSRRELCALVLASATACQRSQKRVIGVVPQGRTHLFWQSIHAGANAAGREAGVEIVWNTPDNETDYNGQIRIVDALINRHVSAIAVSPIDTKAMVSVVERAANENIPVVIFDTGVDTEKFVAQVATDNYGAGRVAGKRMGEILKGQGKIVMVKCQPGSASTVAREKGFEDVIQEQFPGIRIVDRRYGMSDFAKSLQVAENMLTAFPDMDGMFASNETSTVGADQAIKGRARKVKLVGFDWSPTLIEDLKAGLIDSLVIQNPFKIGYDSVMAAVKKLNGGTPEKIQKLPPRLITRDDLANPQVQAQLNPDLKKYLD